MTSLFSIGEVAKRAGVSVQTLRHYGKLGLLAPSQLSAAGYRRYSERDVERLQLIRALRDLGFDLDTIARLLDRRVEPRDAVRLRLEALELEQRALKRRQLVLQSAMNGKRQELLARLQRKHVLAKLDKAEREDFLARQIGWQPDESPASQAVWRAATADLPEEMNDAQLEAWIEIAEIVTDERFLGTLERQRRSVAELDPAVSATWAAGLQRIFAGAVQAVREQREPDDEASRKLVDDWIESLAGVQSRKPDLEFTRYLLAQLESTYDPRIGRYWELLAKLKNLPHNGDYARASEWVLASLRGRLREA